MPHGPNHATSDFREPSRDDESSGPFGPFDPSSSIREAIANELKVQAKSTKYFKGLQLGIPWTLVLCLGGYGGYDLWINQHDSKMTDKARDVKIQEVSDAQTKLNNETSESLNKFEKKLDKLSDKMDNLTNIILRK